MEKTLKKVAFALGRPRHWLAPRYSAGDRGLPVCGIRNLPNLVSKAFRRPFCTVSSFSFDFHTIFLPRLARDKQKETDQKH
jgi:hypothetical protein